MVVDGGDANSSADSIKRRQLLFSLLTATGSTILANPATAQAAEAAASSVLISSAEDWSNIDIMKPPLDDRDYVAYMLDNGLKVILCSDPTSNEAGAAMDVHVGACSDPVGVKGLAHFNEHMLFLGTKKYPQEDSFESFLSSNGGSSNAYTASEDTVYHFTMDAEGDSRFAEGLDRFGSFFTSPLFTPSSTGRELNAIESENAKNLQSDNFRIYQLEKTRQNPDHPHSKFFTGNKQTLLTDTKSAGLDLRQELLQFYDAYYSANQMTLAIVGPQSIDTLKNMVDKAFAAIPNRNVGKPEDAWAGIVPPYNGNSLIPSFQHVVKVVPVMDLRQVSLMWPITYESSAARKNALFTKQSNYVAHLLGHEGVGSLLSYLKRNGLANSLSAASESELADYETFELTVGLTRKGLAAMDNVVEAIFSYLSMIKSRAIPKYVYGEVLQLEELQWRFLPKTGVDGYVTSLATSLQKYPPSLSVAGPRRLALSQNEETLETSSKPRSSFSSKGQLGFTEQLTKDFISKLTVNDCMLTVMSKTFEGKTDRTEPWYGTQYSVERIPDSTLNQWRNAARPSVLGIDFPKPNVFIPSESGLRVKNPPLLKDRFQKRTFDDRMIPNTPPKIIRDDGVDGRWTVHYKPDDQFGQPKAFVIFQLLTREVYASPLNAALSSLYDACVSDKLGEYAYDGKGMYFFIDNVRAPVC
jgi:insulysin